MSPECSEICKVGGHIIRDSEGECAIDCYSTCCKYLTKECKDKLGEDKEQCVRDSLGATEEEACCLARVEGQPPVLERRIFGCALFGATDFREAREVVGSIA